MSEGWSPAAWVALAALACTLLCAIVAGAFYVGKHSNRIEHLESGHRALTDDVRKTRDEAAAAKAEQASLSATMSALKQTVDTGFEDLKRTLHDALANMRAAPSRRNGSGD
jgi:hypothetical protein